MIIKQKKIKLNNNLLYFDNLFFIIYLSVNNYGRNIPNLVIKNIIFLINHFFMLPLKSLLLFQHLHYSFVMHLLLEPQRNPYQSIL